MPIRVQNDLPVKEILEHENIFVMDEYRAAPVSYTHLDVYKRQDFGQRHAGYTDKSSKERN